MLCPEPEWCRELEEALLQTQEALAAAEEQTDRAQREVARLLQHTRTGAEQSVGSQDTSELEALESMVCCCGACVAVIWGLLCCCGGLCCAVVPLASSTGCESCLLSLFQSGSQVSIWCDW